ncbi:hypothetical protein Gbth_114_001 [Gluconobacter thailandicus F149-1 = NBRC 100600]|nr:hypothetical protein Gbth_114_001 [Gluconobacter thailandicus F149-1 = NBRC 100600]GBR60202.1 hypothetical protein AA100600_1820 [Gluconobacter thailandicus F149-1 = NBRC 100600]GEL88361.1 hypothetical protein GTH01_27190 [Gluconobacter thailandicus F149-1 = NBRC 100600]
MSDLIVTGQWRWNFKVIRDDVGLSGIRRAKTPVCYCVWRLQTAVPQFWGRTSKMELEGLDRFVRTLELELSASCLKVS